jgi:hypothetical protein
MVCFSPEIYVLQEQPVDHQDTVNTTATNVDALQIRKREREREYLNWYVLQISTQLGS